MTFEQSLKRLSEIVELLESDNTTLDDGMKLYEEGVRLAGECRRQLETAELKITELRQQANGNFIEEPFDAGNA